MIELREVVKTYNPGKSNAFEALHGVSMRIKEGEMLAIMGTSGAGKSTLLHILACIDRYDSGEYLLDGELMGKMPERKMAYIRNEKIGMVMQDFALIEDYTVLENVMIPLDFSRRKWKRGEKKILVKDTLRMLGMEEYLKKPVKKLSGGQKQRVAIARAMINEPSFILADEPTGALDSKTTEDIMKVFRELNQMGRTIVIVTHDPIVAEKCDRLVEIRDGNIVR